MKITLVLLFTLLLAACGQADRVGAALTGYSEQCVDGVIYLQFTSGATVKVTPDGKPATCK